MDLFFSMTAFQNTLLYDNILYNQVKVVRFISQHPTVIFISIEFLVILVPRHNYSTFPHQDVLNYT